MNRDKWERSARCVPRRSAWLDYFARGIYALELAYFYRRARRVS